MDVTLLDRSNGMEATSRSTATCVEPHTTAAGAWGEAKGCDVCAERHVTAPQRQLGERSVAIPVGRGVGGSANVNAMLWSRGHPGVFDALPWPREWSYAHLEPHFSRVERLVGVRRVLPSVDTAMGSVLRGWFKHTASSLVHGGAYHVTHDEEGQRIRLEDVLLHHATTCRGRLTLLRSAEVVRLAVSVSEDGTGSAVTGAVTTDGRELSPLGRGEVVLCAGALATPSILRASGMLTLASPLLDHSFVPVLRLGPWWTKCSPPAQPSDRDCGNGAAATASSSSSSSSEVGSNGVHGLAYLDTHSGSGIGGVSVVEEARVHTLAEPPHTQLVLVDGGNTASLAHDLLLPRWHHWVWARVARPLLGGALTLLLALPPTQWLLGLVYGVLVCNVRPSPPPHLATEGGAGDSAGDPGYNGCASDRARTLAALQTTRAMLAAVPSPAWSVELLPGPLPLPLYMRLFTCTYYHPAGTCRMGSPEQAGRLLNAELRLLRAPAGTGTVAGLRVVDASVLPSLPTAPPAATIMAVADRAASLMLLELEGGQVGTER